MTAPQQREQRHHMRRAVGHHAQLAPGQQPFPGQQGACLVLGREQPRGDREHALAERGQRDAAAVAVEQGHAEAGLQRPHLRRQRRLAGGAGARRLGEPAGLGDEVEGAQQGEVHRTDLI